MEEKVKDERVKKVLTLSDKEVEIEQELNLDTNEGQFYVLIADSDEEERIIVE